MTKRRANICMLIGFGWFMLEVIVIVTSPLWCAGCSDASFEVAALERAETEGDEQHANETGNVADVSGDRSTDSAAEAGEVDPADGGPDGDSGTEHGDSASVDAADTTPDADAGCPLYGHDDPLSSTSYDSCLPTGIPGDGSTYSKSLLDGEIVHATSKTPWITWGTSSDLSCDGQSCEVHSLTVDAGVAYGVWCSTGYVAGWFIETGVGVPAMCPTSSVHGIWR